MHKVLVYNVVQSKKMSFPALHKGKRNCFGSSSESAHQKDSVQEVLFIF